MLTIFSPDQRLHAPESEFSRGRMIPYRETPARADSVLAGIVAAGLGPVETPEDLGTGPVLAVHDAAYVDFLQTCWTRWRVEQGDHPAFPTAWPLDRLGQAPPRGLEGELGWYCFDSGTAIGPGTWEAALASAHSAATAAMRVSAGATEGLVGAAFALCRPPGHHAAAAMMGGYCYFNNAAIAAQTLRHGGAAKVAVVDVDFHHGNGTQAIFWTRADVLVASLHADPSYAFPYYCGFADETGAGPGEGATLNMPLPKGMDDAAYLVALATLLRRVAAHGADALVVSLGVDTFGKDPLSAFALSAGAYPRIGAALAGLGLPTVLVMEGGYATEATGRNVAAVLGGFTEAFTMG